MERRAILVRGTVQGVGFRPFVFGLASQLCLSGFVRNRAGAVQIEIEGELPALDQFITLLSDRLPVLARITELNWAAISPEGDRDFVIEASASDGGGPIVITPDVGTCDDCIAELLDPRNRRYRYPFINCTNCGPRLTIVTGAPYDRPRTTMAAFPMCAACQAEYENPRDRRFHAQPIACPVCGPQLRAVDRCGKPLPMADPLAWFASALRRQVIGAMKGLGGYHLICDAGSAGAICELRKRKHRDEKPLAVMVADMAAAEALCEIEPAERALLMSLQRPIVLLKKRRSIAIDDSVAPGNARVGVMLPYTPLHHLLMRDVGMPLVMTSGNRTDEPIAYQEPDAFARLGDIADVFLTHDRPIHVRCDDSVTRIMGGRESPIRRSRGYAPQPIRLPIECTEPILAVGGQMKGAFALGTGRQTVLSQHMGDLDHFEAFRAFERDVQLYEALFAVRPGWIAHDMHPDYASTVYAKKRAAAEGLRLFPVQHHHAHMASCMAEHGLNERVIGVIWDGTGYGTDGTIWGGEFMVGDCRSFVRAAHFRDVPLPGGEKAVREPWRMAMAQLLDGETECPSLQRRIAAARWRTVEQMIARGFNCPRTSSAGRLFDAVAAIAGVRDIASYEGQAAVELEQLAMQAGVAAAYPFEIPAGKTTGEPAVIDVRPMVRDLVREVERAVDPAVIARRFHSTLAEIILCVCSVLSEAYALKRVVFSGGVFMNSLLMQEASGRLLEAGFDVYQHRLVPPNDGGISLGQVAVAASQMTPV